MDNDKYISLILDGFKGETYRKIINTFEEGYKGLYLILKVIRDHSGEIIAGEIASKLNISTARVAVALNTLERKKYIIKHKSKDDRRKTVVELTETGLKVLGMRETKLLILFNSILESLDKEEINKIISIIYKIKNMKLTLDE